MRALDQKLTRDFRTLAGQATAIAAVVACGIAVFVAARTTLSSLDSAKRDYYAKNRFAEIFAPLTRAPTFIARRAAAIPGVAAVDHRVVKPLTIDIPSMPEPAEGRVISLPSDADSPTSLNLIHLTGGRTPDPGRPGETLVSETFATTHQLTPGDQLRVTMNGRRQLLSVVGIALSPEYLIQVQPGSIFPDSQRFGVLWMHRRQLEAAFDMKGAFNDLAVTLTPDADHDGVITQLDHLLTPYGGGAAYDHRTHLSARFIDDDIQGLRIMGIIPPSIFLAVAAFLLNMSLRRILALQREQIAALKAFGYTNLEIAAHYGKLVALIILVGTTSGCLLGTWLGRGMTDMYIGLYRFPVPVFAPTVNTYLIALSFALGTGGLGVFSGIRTSVRLQPAEAMRPAPPPDYQPSFIEHQFLRFIISQPARIVVRELSRRPLKAGLASLGIAFATAILIVGNFGRDAIMHIVEFQFGWAERDDARVVFTDPKTRSAIHELNHIDGILRAEPFRAVSAKLRHGHLSKQLAITGLSPGGELFRLLDSDGHVVPVSGGGVVLSSALSSLLDLKVGSPLEIEILEGKRPTRTSYVSGFVDDFAGTNAYMTLPALNHLLREGPSVSGAYLSLDENKASTVFGTLKNTPHVAAVSLKKATLQGFLDTFAESLLRMRLINITFASIIAVGVVYNSARIAFSERARDLATLRVIGLTRSEVSSILLGELATLTAVAIPIGFAIGTGLCYWLATALDTVLFRMPFVIRPSTFAVAAGVVLAASAASGLLVRRRVDRLDLISALKIRE